jgi:hypothetical protein
MSSSASPATKLVSLGKPVPARGSVVAVEPFEADELDEPDEPELLDPVAVAPEPAVVVVLPDGLVVPPPATVVVLWPTGAMVVVAPGTVVVVVVVVTWLANTMLAVTLMDWLPTSAIARKQSPVAGGQVDAELVPCIPVVTVKGLVPVPLPSLKRTTLPALHRACEPGGAHSTMATRAFAGKPL